MQDQQQDLEISVNVGPTMAPRLRFVVAGQSLDLTLTSEAAARLASSLLAANFLCSIGQPIPEGTPVGPGQIPVTGSTAQCDPETHLPTLTVTLMGGGELALVFSPDLAIASSDALAHEGVRAAQRSGETSPGAPS